MECSQTIGERGTVSTGKSVKNGVNKPFNVLVVNGDVSIVGDIGEIDGGADAAIVWWVHLLLGNGSGVSVGKVHRSCFGKGAYMGFAMGM